jgi:hypothetical protein
MLPAFEPWPLEPVEECARLADTLTGFGVLRCLAFVSFSPAS